MSYLTITKQRILMRCARRVIFAGAALVIVPPASASLQTDGHRIAPLEETSRFYDCGEISATIRYRVQRDDDIGEIQKARRVTLLGIAVNGRDLSAAELERATVLFRRFGEVGALGSNCREGFLDVRVFGSTPAQLAASLETGETLDNELWTIRLSSQGIVFVR